MKSRFYRLNEDYTVSPIGTDNPAVWPGELEAELMKPYRQIGDTVIDGTRISTVFLAIDHSWREDGPPILFETMIFGGDLDGLQWRYSTYEQAVAGHQAVVKRVEELAKKDAPAKS